MKFNSSTFPQKNDGWKTRHSLDSFWDVNLQAVTSLKINGWNIVMEVWEIMFLSKWVICRYHVNLPGVYPHLEQTSQLWKMGPRKSYVVVTFQMKPFSTSMIMGERVSRFLNKHPHCFQGSTSIARSFLSFPTTEDKRSSFSPLANLGSSHRIDLNKNGKLLHVEQEACK